MFSSPTLELQRLPWLKDDVPALKAEIKLSADQAQFEQILEDRALDAPIKLKVADNFNTACWSYTSKPATHNMVIGTGIINRAKPGLTQEGLQGLTRAYHRH